jgi:glycosyltransferase involved in cell wall biosynthesis
MSDNGSIYDLGELDKLKYNSNDNKLKRYNPYNKKYDKNPHNYKIFFCIILFLLIIIIILLFLNLYFKLEKTGNENTNYVIDNPDPTKNRLEELLPKLNSNEDNESHTIKEILEARELFINDKNITNEYVKLFKTLSKEEDKIYKEKKFDGKKFHHYMEEARSNQLNYSDFYYLCNEEKLINPTEKIESFDDPFFSIILPSYNKEKELLKSVRSIQNQSFKKIEIIIVDDYSTDNSDKIYKYLLNSDPRIRIFRHQKNFGVWRTRLDGYLYSRGKYLLHFDPGDFYADNLVLEDGYNLVTEYQLDSLRFAIREIYDKENVVGENYTKEVTYPKFILQIYYGRIEFPVETVHFGSIWSRIVRSSLFAKGLFLLDENILNAYKNLWEDRWWNQIANRMVFSNLVVNRVGYLYFRFVTGEGTIKINTDEQRFKVIKEFIYFLLFDYQMSSRMSDKKSIIEFLWYLSHKEFMYFNYKINLSYLNKKFPIFDILMNKLLNDPFVYKEDKEFLTNLYYKIKNNLE